MLSQILQHNINHCILPAGIMYIKTQTPCVGSGPLSSKVRARCTEARVPPENGAGDEVAPKGEGDAMLPKGAGLALPKVVWPNGELACGAFPKMEGAAGCPNGPGWAAGAAPVFPLTPACTIEQMAHHCLPITDAMPVK